MRRVVAATVAGLATLGALAPEAGAVTGSCPSWQVVPSGFSRCIDKDHHVTGVLTGVLDVETTWFDEDYPGQRGVRLSGTIRIDPIGDYTAVAEYRDHDGVVLQKKTWRFSRLHQWLQPVWWKDISTAVVVDDDIASVRYTLKDNIDGNVSVAKISRPTD